MSQGQLMRNVGFCPTTLGFFYAVDMCTCDAQQLIQQRGCSADSTAVWTLQAVMHII